MVQNEQHLVELQSLAERAGLKNDQDLLESVYLCLAAYYTTSSTYAGKIALEKTHPIQLSAAFKKVSNPEDFCTSYFTSLSA